MPSFVFYMIILNGFTLCYGSQHEEHACIHDEIVERNPHIVNLAAAGRRDHKRQAPSDYYSNIRIHPVFTSIDSTVASVEMHVRSTNSSVSASIETLERMLMVHPVEGNLLIPPLCDEFTVGPNVGKCRYSLENSYMCGELAVISQEYIGVREVCSSSDGPCSLQGPNSTGIPGADFLLFVSASSTSDCAGGTLAYASTCMLDINDNNRPIAGYINICPSSLAHFRGQSTLIYYLILHEIFHAIGFSSSLFNWFIDENGNNYNPSKTTDQPYRGAYIFTGPKTRELARSYYSCDNLEGLFLENEGGSGTASSHWEKRTLNNEIMNGYSSRDYEVLSEFTLAFLEDSGWYKANYTALSELSQNSLQWGKGLGCSFTTQGCSDINVFPYLCEDNTDDTMCTYDHLSKGTCSDDYSGFDGCPVLLAADVTHYCRTELDITVTEVESYGVDSICVQGVKSLSYSCGTYITKPAIPLCVQQTTYEQNNHNQYTIQIQNGSHVCRDAHAVITDSSWVILCPPTENVTSQATIAVPGKPSELLSSEEITADNLDSLGNLVLPIGQDVVAFGGIRIAQVSAQLYINSVHSDDTVPICHLSGCVTCNNPIMIENNRTTVINDDSIFSVKSQLITGMIMFIDTRSQSSDYSLLLMLNPLANYSFVYYVTSIGFVDDYLQSYLNYVIHIIALANNTVVRIAPSDDININEMTVNNGEEYTSTMDIGDTLTISSGEDLTGSRITSNKAISLYSGHHCEPDADNCSLLIQQIPPFNSWGSYFILHTNISYDNGLIIGNWLKIVASDIGANVTLNCTTDGVNYESSGYPLDFREHIVLPITHDHCAITSDENILILQFQSGGSSSSRYSADTFMLVVLGLVHYANHYVFNTFGDFSFAALTVPNENPNFNPLLVNNSVQILDWNRIELNTEICYYITISLPAGTHTIAFVGNYVSFGVTIYGSNTSNTYALPAGMRLDLTTNLPLQVPSPVQEPTLTLLDGIIQVTWKPPAVPNGIIYQYIVQRINASGRFFTHILPNQLDTSLVYYNDALVSVTAVNLYGQSQFEYAESKEACLPSPCINGGTCITTMDGGSQEMFHCACAPQFTGVYCETAAPSTNAPPTDSEASTTSDSNELIIIISVTICATILMVIVVGSVLFLYIRQKFLRRARIVDISQVTKSAGVFEAKPNNQFAVKGNDNKAVFYINYPQNPLVNDGNSDTNEICTYT